MDNKLITGIIGVVVVVALLGSALVPVIDGLTEGEKTKNEGAGWIRMDYVTGANYSVDVSFDAQGNVKVDYGVPGSGMTDTQTHAADEDTILFASSEMSIWLQDGVINILGKDIDDNVIFDQITESGPIAFLTKDGSGSEFNIDAGATTGLKASTWAYVPKSTGNFGFFDAGTPVDMKDYPIAAIGEFAGAYAYNNVIRYGLGLYIHTEYDEDGKLISATWTPEVPAEPEVFDPSSITLTPLDPGSISLDPSIIDPDLGGGASLMALPTPPTPTYTDGVWGYDLTTVSGVDKAIIVSYSGPGGDIVVPATVGGYDVYKFGKGSMNSSSVDNSVFDPTSLMDNSTLTLPEGLEIIGGAACSGRNTSLNTSVSKFVGEISIPSTVKEIGQSAFEYNYFSGAAVIPGSVTWLGQNCFNKCPNITSIVILGSGPILTQTTGTNTGFESVILTASLNSAITPSTNVFRGPYISEFLDLSTTDIQPGTYGLSADVIVSDSIEDCIGYVSFVEIGSDAEISGGAAALLIAVPIVVIAGLLVAFVGYSIVKRY